MTTQTHTAEALKNICRHTYFWNKYDLMDEPGKVSCIGIELKLVHISEDYSLLLFHRYEEGMLRETISLTADEAIEQLIPIL